MKLKKNFIILILVFGILLLISRCEKDDNQKKILPSPYTVRVSNIKQNWAICEYSYKYFIDYAFINGVCWSTNQNPTFKDSKKIYSSVSSSFPAILISLIPNTTYYVRSFAIVDNEIIYGNILSFKTLPKHNSIITDIDGNEYNTVVIGKQTWMAENLETTRYNDGTLIPLVTDNKLWSNLSTPAYCWFNNDKANYGKVYGALYNWYTVDGSSNGGKNVCPIGWHVPTIADWDTLTSFIRNPGGGIDSSGSFLKVSVVWDGTDKYGFTGILSAYRNAKDNGRFYQNCSWLSSSEFDTEQNWLKCLIYLVNGSVPCVGYKNDGINIRCLKDTIAKQ